jgi:hypothetical protein
MNTCASGALRSKTDLALDYTNENIDGVSIHQLDDVCGRTSIHYAILVCYITGSASDHTSPPVPAVRWQLSRRSFPLCMRNLHENFRKNHHLKHWGRLQYGLFLKVIALRCMLIDALGVVPGRDKGMRCSMLST